MLTGRDEFITGCFAESHADKSSIIKYSEGPPGGFKEVVDVGEDFSNAAGDYDVEVSGNVRSLLRENGSADRYRRPEANSKKGKNRAAGTPQSVN